jgi:hypothetical protein
MLSDAFALHLPPAARSLPVPTLGEEGIAEAILKFMGDCQETDRSSLAIHRYLYLKKQGTPQDAKPF